MDQDKIKSAFRILRAYFSKKRPTEEEIGDFNDKFLSKLYSKEETDEAIRKYKQKFGITMGPGELLAEIHQNEQWYDNFKKDNSHTFSYSERYENYLRTDKCLSESVINATITNNEITIKNFADPNSTDKVARFGLVVGDVQAGKTLNYIGLINRAVDCGYKNIILLTGTTEELRKQTQERIDEGFVGCKSETLSNNVPTYEGVGEEDNKKHAITLTTYDRDYSIKSSRSLASINRSDLSSLPVIYVVKKNARVLKEITKFILKDEGQALSKDSLLVIDDECDYASLNTKSKEDPTAINKEIRRILSLFTKSTYVGYSATPYANIFVNPEEKYNEDKSGQIHYPDLFPSDFIVLLESPKNYIGANNRFVGFEETDSDSGKIKQVGKNSDYVHIIGYNYVKDGIVVKDNNYLAPNHKKDTPYLELADSLKKALKVFLLSSCVYSLRGYEKCNRTRLVNISRFNNVQEEIGSRIRSYISDLRNAIRGNINMGSNHFNSHPLLNDLESIWESDDTFSRGSASRSLVPNKEFSFQKIKTVLQSEIDKMEVFVINNQHKKDRLNYKYYENTGVRGIVVGGFTLSRGLTLQGLMTSYYSRNARAYDTLIQRGRWFGYRDDYDDLINIYMPKSSIDSFCAAAEATDDLKAQFRRMAAEHKKPKDFGLMVREAPSTLENIILITARNKRKNSSEITQSIDLKAKSIDTSKISIRKEINQQNYNLICQFLTSLDRNKLIKKQKQDPYFMNISKGIICDFLTHFHVSSANPIFNTQILIDFIRENSELDNWFVVVEHGHEKSADNLDAKENMLPDDFKGYCVKRSFSFNENEDFFRVGRNKNTISNPEAYSTGLSVEHIKERKEEYKKVSNGSSSTPSANFWLSKRKNPFLVIYPIELKATDSGKSSQEEYTSLEKEKLLQRTIGDDPIYGIALGFPGKISQCIPVKYKINLIKQRELSESNDIDEDEDEEQE